MQQLEDGRIREAAAGFRRVISLQPTSAEVYYNLGIALKDLDRNRDSATAYLTALLLRPAFPQAHFNLGRAFQLLSDDPRPGGLLRSHSARREALFRAAHHFGESRSGAGSSDALRSLEEVLHQLNDTRGARDAYNSYLQSAPHDGLRPRHHVPCERMCAALEQMGHGRPPRSLCAVSTTAPAALAQRFATHGHVALPSLLPADALSYVQLYYRRLRASPDGGFYRDEPTSADRIKDSILAKDRWALDNDALGLFLAQRLAPLVGSAVGFAVKPGFVKAAWYEKGAKLPPHRDQVQNLISLSLVVAASPAAERWPLVLLAAPAGEGEPLEMQRGIE